MFYLTHKGKFKKLSGEYFILATSITNELEEGCKINLAFLDTIKNNLISCLSLKEANKVLGKGGFFRHKRSVKEYFKVFKKLEKADYSIRQLSGFIEDFNSPPGYVRNKKLLERLLFNEFAENFSAEEFTKSIK